jgi:hypothetical protein
MVQISGLVSLLKNYTPTDGSREGTPPATSTSDQEFPGFSRSILQSLMSTLYILAAATKDNANVVITLYSEDIIPSLAQIFRSATVAISRSNSEQTEKKASMVIKREQQHLRLVLPALSVLSDILTRLSKSGVKAYCNTKLLDNILDLHVALTHLPCFGGLVPPFSANGHAALVDRAHSLIVSVLASWMWSTVPVKVVERSMSLLSQQYSSLLLLTHCLPAPGTFQGNRSHWIEAIENQLPRIRALMESLILTSTRPLFDVIVELCLRLLDVNLRIGQVAVIQPVMEQLQAAVPQACSDLSSPHIHRILYLVFKLCSTGTGKALFLQSGLVHHILPLFSPAAHCSHKILSISFALLHSLTNVNKIQKTKISSFHFRLNTHHTHLQ